jgi:glycosyltransferase involved in cell wall biosynthesis
MSRSSFSVVTPSLNQGRFVGAAIESVLAQEVPDVEHIVVDGGSTDETHNVLARYPHLIVLRDEGRGQSQAVNLGFRAASGDVIGWVNADDCYVPGAFDGARRAFAKHPDAGFVYGNAE